MRTYTWDPCSFLSCAIFFCFSGTCAAKVSCKVVTERVAVGCHKVCERYIDKANTCENKSQGCSSSSTSKDTRVEACCQPRRRQRQRRRRSYLDCILVVVNVLVDTIVESVVIVPCEQSRKGYVAPTWLRLKKKNQKDREWKRGLEEW